MDNIQRIRAAVKEGETFLGIEFGSTRIKAVLIGADYAPIASGSYAWENRLINGVWTYTQADILMGLQGCYSSLVSEVFEKYGVVPTTYCAMGISAMMHGYLAFDHEDKLLVPFRTWRNTTTAEAANQLTELFGFNIPQRWSIAHLTQAILDDEPHVAKIAHITTLAGYVHHLLTGERVLGVGDASGMFPIDEAGEYDSRMIKKYEKFIEKRNFIWRLKDLLPRVLRAGEMAGCLTAEGAALLDPTGNLQAGIAFCPPEGDAGTGMTATCSVSPRTGNVSAGTSVFAMVVLEKPLSSYYPEVDMVTTPTGEPVAMVHCNNCTGELDAWVRLFGEALEVFGAPQTADRLYQTLFQTALSGDYACNGLMAFNYLSGEPITGLAEGRPMFARRPESELTLANFMKTQLYASLATLRLGMDLLSCKEQVAMDRMMGHGGFFKVDKVGQSVMSAALKAPVSVLATAGEGGPWGMALLAAYRKQRGEAESLADFLSNRVFVNSASSTIRAKPEEEEGFSTWLKRYCACLDAQRSLVESL
ncbi:MAG: FGGY-family carbohydrate kinase [Clostridia bacterium]|nr:FGGY-family carbohydrate kinase [Clostridia bacterium]